MAEGPMRSRRHLTVVYDVTDLSQEEVDGLTLEAVVQAERSEAHPTVEVVGTEVAWKVVR